LNERKILVTGGAGFIGSHTCVELINSGHDIVVIDDYSNSSPAAMQRVAEMTGRTVPVYDVDLRNRAAVSAVLDRHPVDAVVHFAAKKAVGESTQLPLEYYGVNVGGTTELLRVMVDHGVAQLVFSSSCSIYGDAERVPLREDDIARPTNPYAQSKWMCEQILRDACLRYPNLSIAALRYFNPVGAHPSGQLGEDPRGDPNNIMPYLMQIAVGRLEQLRVFGSNYPTPDGTGVRDYIHVMDVADGHRVALESGQTAPGFHVFNLGTGVGTSVLQLVRAFELASGVHIPYRIVERRAGDVPTLVADASRVAQAWGWHATRDLSAMCRDSWEFQRQNPHGYGSDLNVPPLPTIGVSR